MIPPCRHLLRLLTSAAFLLPVVTTLNAQTATLNGLSADAEVRLTAVGDGGGSVANASAASLFIGNTNTGSASLASPVFVFQLPNLGAVANPFSTVTFSVALVSASDFNGFSADVYGLGARDLPNVLASDAFAGGTDSTDAVRLADNWINLNVSGISTGVRTLSNAALANYLNNQYAGGAGAGRYVFIRISPDAGSNIWKNTRFASSEATDAAQRPTMTYTLAVPPPPNTAPILPGQADRSVQALETLSVVNTATDADLPSQSLSYELLQAPSGATISAAGIITWTPTILQAGATYTIETRVTDSGQPPLSATNVFQVTVAAYVPPPNAAPVLPAQADRTLAAGQALSVVNTATDTPGQTLTYELLQAPAGATISSSGVIAWSPTLAQAGGSFVFETRVTDDGDPPLSATNSFVVSVSEPGAYQLTLDLSTAGQFFQNFRITRQRDGGTSGQTGNTFSFDGVADWAIAEVYTFDLTPGDPRTSTQSTFAVGAPLTVSFDARVTTGGSAVGVEFTDPRNPERSVLAYFSINVGADTFRFFRNTDGAFAGTLIGSAVNAATDAEPGGAFVRVSVTLQVSGGVPSLTLAVPGADPVTLALSASDVDWPRTLVSLRLLDAGQGTGTPIQVRNIQISAGGAPAEPLPPIPPAPPVLPSGTPVPAGANLLADNPSFETAAVSFGNGNYSFAGWTGRNQRFGVNATTNAGSPGGGGNRAFRIEWGGNLETAVASRPAVTPHFVYELTWDVRTTQVNWPEYRPGSTARLEFFDASGTLLKSYWGPDWRPQVPSFQTTPWQTFSIRGVAPAGAVRAGVRFVADAGQFIGGVGSREDNRVVEIDQFRLVRFGEPIDRVAVRRAPRLVQPGTTAELRIHHAAVAARRLSVDLVNAGGAVVATAGYDVPAGRGLNTVWVTVPNALPDGTYSWRTELRPLGGGAAVATNRQTGVLADSVISFSTAENGRDFDADHPNLVFMGRIEDSNPKRRWMHWAGSEVRVRFSGTSLALLGSAGSNGFGGATPTDVHVVINEDHAAAFPVRIASHNASGSVVIPIVSGLPDGVHTARIFKAGETSEQVRVDGFRVDAGRGLLRSEPLPARRLELFGDSVTGGGNARLNYFGYAFQLGREIDADVHVISKGGTGVAASFAGQDLLGNYWNRLSFPNTTNASTGLPWDFSRWTPDGVVIAIGHNDQFNGGSANFATRYAEFLGKLRTQYGTNLPVLATNTIISNPVSHFEPAVLPLTATDSRLRWVHQLSASAPVGGHPSTQGHTAMVFGDATRFSLADVIEEHLGWGLSAPLTPYESWAIENFTPAERAAGLHAPDLTTAVGESNAFRYAFGESSPGSVRHPVVGVDPTGRLQLSFRRLRADVDYIVETSTDLKTWISVAVNPGATGGDVIWTDALPAAPRQFVRLRIALGRSSAP